MKNLSGSPVEAFPIHYFPPTESREVKLVATPEQGIGQQPGGSEGVVLFVDLSAHEEKLIQVR